MIRICKDLLEEGAVLQILNPKVSERQMALDLGQPPGAGEGSRHCVHALAVACRAAPPAGCRLPGTGSSTRLKISMC